MRLSLLAAITLVCAPFLVGQDTKPGAKLKYAVILTRHGVRSPTWTLERLNEYSSAPWPDWKVPPGYLTPHGRELMKIMGAYYRERFTAEGLFNRGECQDARGVYFWADTDQRTLETAKALAEGIMPGCTTEIHSMAPEKHDPLFDATSTGLAKQDPKLGRAAVAGRIGPKLDAVTDAYRPAFDALAFVLNGNGKAAKSMFDEPMSLTTGKNGVAIDGPLHTASTMTENLLLAYANGFRGDQLGWGRLNQANLLQMMILHTTYADWMRRTPYLARVRASNLLSHILRSLEQAAAGKAVKGALGTPSDSLLVISGHDTNISNLSGLLGLSWLLPSFQRDDAPPGGALVFSLWQESGTGPISVRVQMISQTLDQMHDGTALSLDNPPAQADLFIPGCSSSVHGYPCEWASFARTAAAAIAPEFVEK